MRLHGLGCFHATYGRDVTFSLPTPTTAPCCSWVWEGTPAKSQQHRIQWPVYQVWPDKQVSSSPLFSRLFRTAETLKAAERPHPAPRPLMLLGCEQSPGAPKTGLRSAATSPGRDSCHIKRVAQRPKPICRWLPWWGRHRLSPRGCGLETRGAQKKEKENKEQKNNPKKQPTDFRLPFFFFRSPLRLASAVGRLWTCHRMWAPAAGCGVFLYELVPSDGPFLWCLYETFFLRTFVFIFSNGLFFSCRATN
jgi:hypothetical protein